MKMTPRARIAAFAFLSDRTRPSVVGGLDVPASAMAMDRFDDYLLLVHGAIGGIESTGCNDTCAGGISLVDVRVPASPVLAYEHIEEQELIVAIQALGSMAVLADAETGIEIRDLSVPSAASMTCKVEILSGDLSEIWLYPRDIVAWGDWAWLVTNNNTLQPLRLR